jgi:hypothetical protein
MQTSSVLRLTLNSFNVFFLCISLRSSQRNSQAENQTGAITAGLITVSFFIGIIVITVLRNKASKHFTFPAFFRIASLLNALFNQKENQMKQATIPSRYPTMRSCAQARRVKSTRVTILARATTKAPSSNHKTTPHLLPYHYALLLHLVHVAT